MRIKNLSKLKNITWLDFSFYYISEIEGLDVFYKEGRVNQLSVTSIELKNNGNVIIEGQDVYKGHELRIVPTQEGVEILYAKVMSQSKDIIGCDVFLNNNTVRLDFQAFEIRESSIINIYHTGGKNTAFRVSGNIKEGKIVKNDKDNKRVILYLIGFVAFSLGFIGSHILRVLLGVYFHGDIFYYNENRPYLFSEFFYGVYILVFLFFLVLFVTPILFKRLENNDNGGE